MSIEEALAKLTAATDRNSDLLERVIAGQEAAIAKLEGKTTEAAPRRTRKAKEDEAAGNATESAPAATEQPAAAAGAASDETTKPVSPIAKIIGGIGTDADKLKEYVSGWTGGTEDQGERQKRVDLLKAMAAQFGVAPKFGELIPHVAKTVFYIERAKALGVGSVSLNGDYDFDGDPAQGGPEAASSDDDF